MKIKVYSDGASRGNPGRSAIAFILISEDGKTLGQHSECIGEGTNNVAEYRALISALVSANNLGDEAHCFLDSQLVVRQITGAYRVKDAKLKDLHSRVLKLKDCFKKISFNHVERENAVIQRVDRMVNEALDEEFLEKSSS